MRSIHCSCWFLYNPWNITGVVYKGLGRYVVGSGPYLPLSHRQWCCVLSRQQGCTQIHRIDQDSHWQQFGTPLILLVLPSSPTSPVMHQCSFTGLVKNSGKAHLAIYSHVVNAAGHCGQCMSVSLILGFNLVVHSCDNLVGFRKSSHMLIIVHGKF